MRRILFPMVAGLACCLPIDRSHAQAPVLSADDLPAETLAQQRRVSPPWRTSPQTVRRYRSYAVVPGEVVEGAQAEAAAEMPLGPARAAAPAPRSSGASKPSFMRADSKARGKFHR